MRKKRGLWMLLSGGAAGVINGLFGGGGGMILVPLLTKKNGLNSDQVFPASVTIIFPICIVSLILTAIESTLPLKEGWPFLIASIPGGLLAGVLGKKIPDLWLHKGLGLLILWGGIRYLC